jgi:hypothetical protein
MKALDFNYGSKDLQDVISLYNEGRLNLNPGFQRDSVWSTNDRKKLIQSILQNYPIPSIFLYKSTDDNGRHKFDVLDGKQRIESVLMFIGANSFKNRRFEIRGRLDEGDSIRFDWKTIQKKRKEHLITGYKIQTVEISGSLGDIMDLFIRINSTGKRLTSQEKRHARFYTTPFLKAANVLAHKYKKYFLANRVMRVSQITRMKHVELICELLASIQSEQLLNKKTALDKIIGGESINQATINKCKKQFIKTMNHMKKIFPDIKSTRFVNSAEFYSLFLLIWKFEKEKLVLGDKKRNVQAQKLLTWLSNGVDGLRTELGDGKNLKQEEQLFTNYLFTTRGDSDSSATRKRREEVLDQLFSGLFEKKDNERGFSAAQRRLFWNSEENKACSNCKEPLTWENFTIDHIKPYALGGKSILRNAALMCQGCNSSKGKKLRSRR